jgi:putative DNA primase/helicase
MLDLDLNNAPPQHESGEPKHRRPQWARDAAASPGEALAAFRAAAQARGVLLPPELIADGEIHRCDVTGHNGDGDAAYLLHLDGLPAGGFQNWQDGIGWQDWHADPGRPLTPAETDELRRKAEADRAKRLAARDASATDAAARAAKIWEKAEHNPDHPYLARKGITAHGARREDRTDNLVISMRDENGVVVNLQRIDHAGEKLFLKGGRKIGCSFTIGKPNGGPILIAEGYSTAASIHQATGFMVVVAFDAGNLLPVAEAIRAGCLNAPILICADDDWKKPGNPGVTKAREAAERVSARIAIPEFGPDRPDKATDFNDVAASRGEAEVKLQIEAALGAAMDTKPVGGAAEPEILPTQPEVSAAIETLTKESDPDSIKAVLEKIAVAHLGPLWEGPMLSRIKDLTGQKIQALRIVLEDAEARQEAAKSPQPTRQIGPAMDWRDGLITNAKDEPRAITANVLIALTRDPTWAGVLALNEFTGFITIRRQPPFGKLVKERAWTDADTRITTVWMQKVAGVPAPSHVAFEGVATVAELSPYHPVRDYLDALIWDNVPRIDDLFVTYFGAIGDAPDEGDGDEALDHWKRRYAYYQAVGARSLIGAVARIYEPGCKNDCSPTLVGDQGTLKSTSIKVLFSEPWFTDEISEFGSKDAAMQTAGVWGIEIGELVAGRRDVDKTKAFMSRSTDRFRPPYGKVVIEQPRQCVFWGTTNRDVFLFDETGNRRMWSVRCGQIDIKRLKADRDQLWAEAVSRFKAKEQWWLHEPKLIATAAEVQAEFVEEDPWNNIVLSFAASKPSVGIDEVLALIGIFPQDRTQVHANRVARILRMAGWTRKQERIDGRQVWRYFNHAVTSMPNTGDATGDN